MSFTVPLLINGEEKTSPKTFAVNSPASHTDIWHYSSASSADIDTALESAQNAFPSWSRTKPQARRAILNKAADLLVERSDELQGHMSQETGAVPIFTGFNIATAAELIRDVAGRVSGIMGSIPICQDEDTSALVLKEPFGVVLAIAPW